MTELISAAMANKLSRPTFEEGLARYKDSIAEAITEAAMGQIVTIKLRVPAEYCLDIWQWLVSLDYTVTVINEEIQDWDFFTISWGKV